MILVSGGTGLVGSHLLYHLLKDEQSVRAIYRSEESKKKTAKVFLSYDSTHLFHKIEWVKADLLDYFSLENCFEGIDLVYHAAAIVSFDRRRENQILEVNIEGTKNMVNLSLEKNIRKFCYISSVAALGEYPNQKCIDEEALWQLTDKTSTYSISKYYAENEVWRAAAEGLKTVIINPSTIIGFGNWEESSSIILKKVYQGLNYYPPGSNGFIGVKDVVKSAVMLMNSNIENERYLLSSENLSFKKLFDQLAHHFKKAPPKILVNKSVAKLLLQLDRISAFLFRAPRKLTAETIETVFKQRCFSSDKLKSEFNFEFQSIDEVLKEVVPKYLANKSY